MVFAGPPAAMASPNLLSSATLSASSTTLLTSVLSRSRTSTSPGCAPTQTLLVNLDELQGGISNRSSYYDAEAMQTLSSRTTHHISPSNAGPSSPRQRASPIGGLGAAAASARASPSPSAREYGMGGGSSALASGSPRHTARLLQLELPAASSDAAAAADPFLSDPILKPEGASAAAAAVSEAAAASTLPASPATPRGGGAGTRAALEATVERMEAELAALKLQLASASA